MSDELLRAEALSKTYPTGTRAVDSVSFSIDRGETFGLVGESGSGKSTIAAMLLGLERPSAGRVHLLGQDITQLRGRRLRSVRKHMQLVMQDPVSALNRRKTVGEIVALPLVVHDGASPKQAKQRAAELLELVGLSHEMLGRYPRELSGGQCQRVGIARALALSPDFLVLDESVSAVDVLMQAQILNLLKRLQKQLGLSYLFVSHDLAVVRYMCDRIGVLKGGKLLDIGDREHIFSPAAHEYTRSLIASAPASLAGLGR